MCYIAGISGHQWKTDDYSAQDVGPAATVCT